MSQDEIFWLERQLWGRVTSPSSFPNHACSAACFVKEALLSDLLLRVLKQDCQRGPAVGLGTRSSDKDFRPRQPFLPTQLFGCPTARASIPCVGGRQPRCRVGQTLCPYRAVPRGLLPACQPQKRTTGGGN